MTGESRSSKLETAGPSTGRLFIVSTPIGNLEDLSTRALRVLREVDFIAAEDTRVTGLLLHRFGIETPMVPFHAHNEARAGDRVLEKLESGKDVALVSDAGTPCISDPGGKLVADAIDRGVPVEPIPGASALLAALVASGIDPTRFVFEGFLPRTNDRRDRLKLIGSETRTVVLYESPVRLAATLDELARHCGDDRRCAVGRELTKKFEEFIRGTLRNVQEHFAAHAARGECVVVLEGAGEGALDSTMGLVDVDALLADAVRRGLSAKDAAREVAAKTGQSRRILYARLVALGQDAAPELENSAS